jgi:hypothetical protein
MPLVTPYWFPARQGKADEAGPDTYRLTGPNLQEAYIHIREDSPGRWSAHLRLTAEGPDTASTPATFASAYEAWEAAFELYRNAVVV